MNPVISKNRNWYFLSAILSNAYIFYTIPFLTSYLSKSEFGIYILVSQIVLVFQASMLALVSSSILKFWVDTSPRYRRSFVGTIFTFYLILNVCVVFSIYLFRDNFIYYYLPKTVDNMSNVISLMAVWIFLVSLKSFLTSFIKALEKPIFIFYQSITYAILLVFFLTTLTLLPLASLEAVLISIILAEVISLLCLVMPSSQYLTINFQASQFVKFIKFSFPLMIASLVVITTQNLDRTFLSQMVTLEDIGVYGVGFMFGNISGVLVTANLSAYLPRVKKLVRSSDENEVRTLTTYYLNQVQDLILISIIGLALFSDLFIYLFAQNYINTAASNIMIGVALGHLARCNFLFYKQILLLKDDLQKLLINELIVCTIGIFAFYILISLYSILGAAFGMMLTYAISGLLTFHTIRKYSLVEISIRKTLLRFAVVVFLLLTIGVFQHEFALSKIIQLLLFIFVGTLFIKNYRVGQHD